MKQYVKRIVIIIKPSLQSRAGRQALTDDDKNKYNDHLKLLCVEFFFFIMERPRAHNESMFFKEFFTAQLRMYVR